MSWIAACGRIDFAQLDAASATSGDATSDASSQFVIYCPLDESTGPYNCGASLSASCVGPCPATTPSNHVNGVVFNGMQDAQLDVVAITRAGYTVSVWFRFDSMLSGGLLSKPYDGSTLLDSFMLFVSSSTGRLYYETTDGALPERTLDPSGIDLRDNVWHHVAATWDGSTKRLYRDGTLVVSQAATAVDSTQPIIIGGDRDNAAPGFRLKGAVDEVRVYPTPLSDADIATLAGN